MTITSSRPNRSPLRAAQPPTLLLNMFTVGNDCVVHVNGELDVATRDQLISESTAGDHPTMVIDLGGVTFMDCGGHSALAAARRIIEGAGRSLTVKGETGQPARLVELIAGIERAAAGSDQGPAQGPS